MNDVANPVERYALLASSIAGCSVAVAPASPGEPAWTDGSTIYVDARADASSLVRTLSVQASLISAGSLAPEVLRRLRTRSSLVSRYVAVEAHRALVSSEPVLPTVARCLIDRETAARTRSPRDSLTMAAARSPLTNPPPEFGTIRPRDVLRPITPAAGEASSMMHRPRTHSPDALRELDDQEEEDGSASDVMSSPVGGGGALGRLLKRLLSDVRGRGSGDPGADSATHVARMGGSRFATMTPTVVRAVVSADDELVRPTAWMYPEWDVHRHRYRPNWCQVHEVDSPRVGSDVLPVPDVRSLRRSLARVGLATERCGRQEEGIDIDIDAAVEAQVDAAAGSIPLDAVYVDLVRGRRDLAVLVLLDVSGSSDQLAAFGGTVHEQQRLAASGLTAALHSLGDRVALYAFRSRGRADVELTPVKRFVDGFGADVMRRLARCTPAGYTRLGAAIRHGAWRLEHDAGMSRRVLVVLSDGFAYDHGYEGAYGEADARRALAEARRRGTGCLCLSLGAPTDPAALRRVFGSAAHATLPRVDQVPDIVGTMFRFALQSAEAQRRVFQRTQRARERFQVEERTA